MAVVNPASLIHTAFENRYAIAAYNVDSLDMAMAVVRGGEAAKVPILIQITVDTLNTWGWERLTHMVCNLGASSEIPMGLHLDHCKQVKDVFRAIDLGFTSVMYDGSTLDMALNIQNTLKVVDYARLHNVMIEAELGHVGREGEPLEWRTVTSVEEASEFYAETHVDCLAVAIGTEHGKQVDEDHIRFDRIRDIHREVPVPLVLHGSSGVPNDILCKLLSFGISKVNIGTELRTLWWKCLLENQTRKPREALSTMSKTLRDYVNEKSRLLSHPMN